MVASGETTGKGYSVLILGTGVVAYPTAMLLREALPDVEVFMAKRSWRDENIGRMVRLHEQYGVKLVAYKEVVERFKEADYHGFKYPLCGTVEDAANQATCIVDCTGLDIKAWYEDLLASRPRDSLRGIAAEGGIGEFGPQFMYGLTDGILDLTLERRVEIPSCNTHALAGLIWGLSGQGKDIDRIRQVVAFLDRRNQDKGKMGGAVQTLTYEPLVDERFGTHQARDAFDIITMALGGKVPTMRLVSHAAKTPQPLMHSAYVGVTVDGEWTVEQVHERLADFPLIAFTDYMSMGQVYDEFCSTSFSSRGYDYAVVVESQTQVVPWAFGAVPGKDEGEVRYSTILLSILVPQEGNAVLSNLACAIKYMYPDDYEDIVQYVIDKRHLLAQIV